MLSTVAGCNDREFHGTVELAPHHPIWLTWRSRTENLRRVVPHLPKSCFTQLNHDTLLSVMNTPQFIASGAITVETLD